MIVNRVVCASLVDVKIVLIFDVHVANRQNIKLFNDQIYNICIGVAREYYSYIDKLTNEKLRKYSNHNNSQKCLNNHILKVAELATWMSRIMLTI